MSKFKPCPFCGNDAPLIQHIEPHRHSFAIGLPDHGGSCVIECGGCDLAFIKSTEAEAVAAWNRRPTAQSPEPDLNWQCKEGDTSLEMEE